MPFENLSDARDTLISDMGDDLAFVRSNVRPEYEALPKPIRVVDLFCGCGGLTVGLAEAAARLGRGIEIPLAVDFEHEIGRVYESNFPKALVKSVGVEELVGGTLGRHLSPGEESLQADVGLVDFLVGGPPCQGHSDLNNHTRREDPRNRFYIRMARAAQVIRPRVVVIENVPPVRNDRGRVVDRASRGLLAAGYQIADGVVTFDNIGVPQRRRRHTVLGLLDVDADPADVLASLMQGTKRDLRWAIEDLEQLDTREPFDQASQISKENRRRIAWLHDNGEYNLDNLERPACHRDKKHSYKSMYGRLKWNEPAQTVTSGFGSMGQGRFVHPTQHRTLTPHEAARIQFFPDWFDFTGGGAVMSRGTWATMIGNAVPPKLTMELGRLLIPFLV